MENTSIKKVIAYHKTSETGHGKISEIAQNPECQLRKEVFLWTYSDMYNEVYNKQIKTNI